MTVQNSDKQSFWRHFDKLLLKIVAQDNDDTFFEVARSKFIMRNGQAHDKSYNKTSATSEDYNQSVHLRISLCWSHVPFTLSRLSKQGWKRNLAILGVCAGCSESLQVARFIVGFVVRLLKLLCLLKSNQEVTQFAFLETPTF